MDELAKIRRVLSSRMEGAPHETVLVLDATTGQNALAQAEAFSETAGVTSLILTKLDGTARGGVIVPLVQRLGLPVEMIGVGEQTEDLRPFVAGEFAAALLEGEKS
jgi:fused signal recognition particle receptor